MNTLTKIPRKIGTFFYHAFAMTWLDAVAILVTGIVTLLDIKSNGLLLTFSIGAFTFCLSHLLMFLLGAIFGYADVSLVMLIIFMHACMYNFRMAYGCAIFLLVGMLGYYFSRKLVFKRERLFLVIITCITMALINGNGFYLLVCLLSPLGFSQVTAVGQVMLFSYMLPEYMIGTAVAYIFFTRAPEKILKKVFCGFFYLPEYEEYKKNRAGKKSKLGRNMMLGLIINLAVIVSTSVYIAGNMIGLSNMKNVSDALYEETAQYTADGNLSVMENLKKLEEYKEDSRKSGQIMPGSGFGEYSDPVAFFIEIFLMFLCIAFPMIMLTYFAFQRITVRPIENLSGYIQGYADARDDEKLSYMQSVKNVEPEVHDDIWEMYNATKRMMRDIVDYIDTQKKEQELESELQVAKEANTAKTNFLSNMSHEIRTPINSILGMNEMILRESTEAGVKQYADNIKQSGDTLLRIVNDILDLSRIEAGKLQIQPQQYDFAGTVNNLISMVDVQAEDKGLKLEVNINPNIPSVLFGDEKRIVQCVTNILSNAVKYTMEGRIELTVDFNKESENEIALAFTVTDTGMGIKQEDLEKLFTPYERFEEKKNYNIEGTGLGMDIVRSLLAMMNSRLTVNSVYGEGSTFSFAVKQEVIQWEPIGDVKEHYNRNKGEEYVYRESFQAPDAKVLVVDDTNMNLVVIKGLLKQTRINIDTADSGKEALKMVQKHRYDIIFIDHRMPGMDGIETHRHMVSDFENPNRFAPCIALTANAISGAREMYLAEGFQDYLAKPISVERLEKMIVKYLPKELVITPKDADFDTNPIKEEVEEEKDAFADFDMSKFEELDGINIKMAMKNCDQPEILKEALSEFHFTIDTHANALEEYVKTGDIRNFTIAVHALKSNSRLIGAMKLSGVAETMEELGNANDVDAINERLPQLLTLYRSYKEKLFPIADMKKEEAVALKDISEEEFEGALADMRELVSVFDYDNANNIMHMLEEYKTPEKYKDKWEKIKQLMAAVDLEGLLNELG